MARQQRVDILRESIPCDVDPAYVREPHQGHLTANEYAYIHRYLDWEAGPEYEAACALHDLHCKMLQDAKSAASSGKPSKKKRGK